jgi:hypothetical protein
MMTTLIFNFSRSGHALEAFHIGWMNTFFLLFVRCTLLLSFFLCLQLFCQTVYAPCSLSMITLTRAKIHTRALIKYIYIYNQN